MAMYNDSTEFVLPEPPSVSSGIFATASIRNIFNQMTPDGVPLNTPNAPYAATNWLNANKTLLIGVGGALALMAFLARGR